MHKKNEIFDVLTNAVCCMMCVDGKITESERTAIHKVLEKNGSPWHYDEVEKRIEDFLQIFQKSGLTNTIEDTCKRLSLFRQQGKEELLIQALNYVMYSDGKIKRKEVKLCERFKSELNREISSEILQDIDVSTQDKSLRCNNTDTSSHMRLRKKQFSKYELIVGARKPDNKNAPEHDKIVRTMKQERKRLQIQKKCEEQQQEYIKLMKRKTEIDKMKPIHPCPDVLPKFRSQLSESDGHLYNSWLDYSHKLIRWEDDLEHWLSINPLFPPNSGYICLNCGCSDDFLKRYCFWGCKKIRKTTGPGNWAKGIKYTTQTTHEGLADFGGLICNRCALKRWIQDSILFTVGSALFLSISGIIYWFVFSHRDISSMFPESSFFRFMLFLLLYVILPLGIFVSIGVPIFIFSQRNHPGANLAEKYLYKDLEKQGFRHFGEGTVRQEFGKGVAHQIEDLDTRMLSAIWWERAKGES